MRFVIQRVKEAQVTVDGEVVGKIGHGLLVFVGICDTDGLVFPISNFEQIHKTFCYSIFINSI